MFHRPAAGPQPSWKRPVYLITTSVLGLLMVLLAQILWLTLVDDKNLAPTSWLGVSFSLQIIVLVIGVIGGFLVGRIWWQWVYIDRRWDGPAYKNN